MNKILSIALLAVGVILIIYGLNANQSVGSSFTRFFTGSPTDKSLWLLVGGIFAAILGLGGLIRGSKTS